MSSEPAAPSRENEGGDSSTDLFGKLDSLIQKHQGASQPVEPEGVPMLTEPIESPPVAPAASIPVLEDAIEAATASPHLSGALAQARRQLQVALYLRLRQRLDQELEAALADNLRLGAVAVDPAFTRVAHEMRAVLPVIVRESVEQVLGPASLEALLSVTGQQSGSRS